MRPYTTLQIPDDRAVLFPKLYKRIDQAMTNWESFAYLFAGGVGTGKSELMYSIASSFSPDRSLIGSTTEIYEDYLSVVSGEFADKSEALKKRENYFRRPFIFIDDLGIELKRYPQAAEYITAGIYKMYYAWKKHRHYCFIITTNLGTPGLPSIQKAFGSRVEDRLIEMLEVVNFGNKSFRQNKKRTHDEKRQGE